MDMGITTGELNRHIDIDWRHIINKGVRVAAILGIMGWILANTRSDHLVNPAYAANQQPPNGLFPSAEISSLPIINTVEVALPSQLNTDLIKIIWYTLTSGGAKYLSPQDFYHCHTLITSEVFEKYRIQSKNSSVPELLKGIINDYAGLLCHAQELGGDDYDLDPSKRNTLIWKGGEPFTVPIENKPSTLFGYPEDRFTVHPIDIDLDSRYGATLYFTSNSKGGITLPDGRRLKVTAEYPDILVPVK